MKHARPDYDRIQDPAGLIPEDEPVFLIRAQDQVGFLAVRAWAHLHRVNGGSDEMYQSAMEWADKMEAWPVKKYADMPSVLGLDRRDLQETKPAVSSPEPASSLDQDEIQNAIAEYEISKQTLLEKVMRSHGIYCDICHHVFRCEYKPARSGIYDCGTWIMECACKVFEGSYGWDTAIQKYREFRKQREEKVSEKETEAVSFSDLTANQTTEPNT